VAITSIFHVNINCTDFERSRRFYEMLGFRTVVDLGVVDGPGMGRGLGREGATGRAAIMMLDPDNRRGCRLDLIEWSEPEPAGAPPPDLFHVGLARLCLFCTALDQHVAQLRNEGVELVSEPVEMMEGTRFVCFRDPDGTFIELIEFS
jgi:catechol 2,3-dioxygenase-like lactoylglutathione lyase family enzyme